MFQFIIRLHVWFLFFSYPLITLAQFEFPKTAWSDSVFASLSYEQRLGQLFMVAAYSNKEEAHYLHLDSLVEKFGIGGVIFFQGGPKRQVLLTRRLQNKSKVPLFIGFDGEWGLQMRLDSTMYFPKQMTLGAIKDLSKVESMGRHIAAHCKALGIHINFAPVVDINNNPNNPVIGVRSFGENKEEVAERAIAYMRGMQQCGVMATAKHFPGHGDTDADSHYDLPVIRHNKKRLEELELYPFYRLFKAGVHGVMVAHLHVPTLDARPNIATTLSQAVVEVELQQKMKFKGLIFTDALNMKGVAKYYQPGEVDVMALKAGNDVLLFAENVPRAITMIKQAINQKVLDSVKVMQRVQKILRAKAYYNLSTLSLPDTAGILDRLWNTDAAQLRDELYADAATLLKNKDKILPIKELAIHKIAWVTVGNVPVTLSGLYASYYAPIRNFHITHTELKSGSWQSFADSLKSYTRVIFSIHDLTNKRKENYGISDALIQLHKLIQDRTPTITVFHGNTLALANFAHAHVLLHLYEDNEVTRTQASQFVFGARAISGKLPIGLHPYFAQGQGIDVPSVGRIIIPTQANLKVEPAWIKGVDSLIQSAIVNGATPGARIIVSHKGQVILDKSYGHLSYDKATSVTKQTVYDLASVTKTAATIPALMYLYKWGDLPLDKPLRYWLPELQNTNKKDLLLKDLLVHQAGLVPFIDFTKRASTLTGIEMQANTHNSLQILRDSLYQWVACTPLQNFKADTGCYPYKYSDLGFYLLQKIIEKVTRQTLNIFLEQNLYKPLGIQATFEPLNRFSIEQIAPTEEDYVFRNQKIVGKVHDPNAALVSGFAAHAGLFSRAQDLLVLGQIFCNSGKYAGKNWYNEHTVSEFTRPPYYQNRRALGWDRPFPTDEVSLADPAAFGHTGFTGTAWWIDPKNEIVFVFLSNRTYPFADNKRLTFMSIRTKLLNQVYKGLKINTQ